MKFTEEQLLQNYQELLSFTELFSQSRKELVHNMFNDLQLQILTAPASAYNTYHGAYPGGLVEHTIHVIKNSIAVYKVWKQSGAKVDNFTQEELIFSAMFHDWGKIGTKDVDYYVAETNDWWIKNRGKMFDYNPKLQHMPHEDRSLFVLQTYNIPVSQNEWIAIKTHNGLYVEGNKTYYDTHQNKAQDFRTILPIIIHQADYMSYRIELEQAGHLNF